MYEGRMMSTDEVLRLKRLKDKPVIETPLEDIVEEVSDEVVETPQEPEVVNDEMETARLKYKELFWRKANPNTKLETLLDKIKQAS